MQFVDLEKPYIIQAPTYRAFPAPTFKWKYKIYGGNKDVYSDSSDDKELYVTLKGNLLIPSIIRRHQMDAKVLVSHPALVVDDSALVMLRWISG